MSIIWVRWMSGTLKKLCSLKRVSKALPSVGWFTNHKARGLRWRQGQFVGTNSKNPS